MKPYHTGTVSNMIEILEAVKIEREEVDKEVTDLANKIIEEDKGKTPELKDSLVAICRPKLRSYIIDISPGRKGNA